jgi:S-adenosylmethionine synthetase
MADQISDAILDDIIGKDPMARVACETMVTTGLVCIVGEITTDSYADVAKVARQTIREIGYDKPEYGFHCDTCAVVTSIDEQSPDISRGVNTGGAGDQGMMVGYAVRETRELMPLPITLAHRLVRRLAQVRRRKILPFLRPDGKSQVTVQYEDGRPVRIEAVVVSCQHDPDVHIADLREAVMQEVILKVLPGKSLDKNTKYHINPTGRFVVGGPVADAGMTGRKIIADTYGGMSSHGGGSFSGKDPTKVDRSGAYAARHVAKNIVAAGIADKCEVQIAYAIGVKEPVGIWVETFGTNNMEHSKLIRLIRDNFDLTPMGIIQELDLRHPIYRKTAVYGHFGRERPEFTWENTDKAEDLRRQAGL